MVVSTTLSKVEVCLLFVPLVIAWGNNCFSNAWNWNTLNFSYILPLPSRLHSECVGIKFTTNLTFFKKKIWLKLERVSHYILKRGEYRLYWIYNLINEFRYIRGSFTVLYYPSNLCWMLYRRTGWKSRRRWIYLTLKW